MKYRILSVAGGGIRAVVSCIWMRKLEELGYLDISKVNLFSGTSAGSLVIAGLIKPDPLSVSDMIEASESMMNHAFKRSKWVPGSMQLLFTGAKYNTKNLEEAAKSVFGGDQVLFGDCRPAVVNVYDRYSKYRNQRRAMGHPLTNFNQPDERESRFHSMPLYKIVTSSSVAPLAFNRYMPDLEYTARNGKHKVKTFNFTDGGQADNLGMASAVRIARRPFCGDEYVEKNYPQASVDFKDMAVLGIGNGGVWNFQHPKDYVGNFLSKCYFRFRNNAKMIIGTLVQETEIRSYETTRDMFGNCSNQVNYLNYQLDREVGLDDLSQFEYLKYFAKDQSEKIEFDYGSYFRGYWV